MNKEMKQGIKDFIAEVNPMIKVYFQSYDLECDVFEEKVYIGRTYDKRTDEYFANFIHELNPQLIHLIEEEYIYLSFPCYILINLILFYL